MYFSIKNYLKSTYNHTAKHDINHDTYGHLSETKKSQSRPRTQLLGPPMEDLIG
jgi:hypothetical protein